MTDKVQKIREEVERLKSNLIYGACASQVVMETYCKEEAYNEMLAILDTMQEEPVSEELKEIAWNYADKRCHLDIAVFTPNEVKKERGRTQFTWQDLYDAVMLGANWQKEHLWKSADGDDLPEYEREVVVFTQIFPDDAEMMMVTIGHRPNPEGWDGKSLSTGKVEHYTPKTYDKGGWNIPNVKYWLDCSIPKEIEL